MLKDSVAFSGFSVDDQAAAQDFYESVLGIEVKDNGMGLELHVTGGTPVFVYEKADHIPATFTVLNFQVDDIDQAVDELSAKGISFEMYENMYQDNKGVTRGKAEGNGPDIAWFKDPAGNIFSILSE